MSILEKKKQRVAEVVEKLEKSELVIFTDYRALSVESMNQLDRKSTRLNSSHLR